MIKGDRVKAHDGKFQLQWINCQWWNSGKRRRSRCLTWKNAYGLGELVVIGLGDIRNIGYDESNLNLQPRQ